MGARPVAPSLALRCSAGQRGGHGGSSWTLTQAVQKGAEHLETLGGPQLDLGAGC